MISNYSTLRTEVAGAPGLSWSHRNDALAKFDVLLQLTEESIYTGDENSVGEFIDGLRVREMETRSTATVSTTSRFLALPDNFLEPRRAELEYTDGNGNKTIFPLKHVIASELVERTSAGRPQLFTVTSQYEFDCTPDIAYTMEVQHYAKQTAISSTNATNSILTNYPSIYLNGCMSFVYKWASNVEKAVLYNNLFLNSIKKANNQSRWGRIGPAPQAVYHGSIA